MRTSLIAFTSIGLLAVALAACGGGSSGSTPSTPAVPAPQSSTTQGVNGMTLGGPTGQMTLTFTVPKRTPASAALRAALKARFGSKGTSTFVRSIMNTSPTAAVRAWGSALNQRAKAAESTRRPDYVSSPPPYSDIVIEFVLASGSTVESDATQTCYPSAGSCTASFNVPVGTNYTAALYLSDDCGYITSAGTATGVNVAPGSANTPLPITANPVVSYLVASSSYVPVTGVANASIPVTVTPYDANDEAVTAPGVLLDGSFDQINTVTLTPTASDITPMNATSLTVPTNLTGTTPYVLSQTYASSGAGATGNSDEWDVAEGVVGAQIVPTYNYYTGAPSGVGGDPYQVQIVPKSIYIAADPQSTIPTLFGLPYFMGTPPPATQAAQNSTTTIEVAEPTPGPSLNLAVLANYPFAGDALSLSTNSCADYEIQYNFNSAFPSPPPNTVSGTEYPFSLGTSGTAGVTCQFEVDDSTSGTSATLNLQLDGAGNVNINGKARK